MTAVVERKVAPLGGAALLFAVIAIGGVFYTAIGGASADSLVTQMLINAVVVCGLQIYIGNTGVLTGFEQIDNTTARPFNPDPNAYKPTNVSGNPTLSGEFAMTDNNHHGSKHIAVWVKAPKDVQEMLVSADAKRFFVPPYVGPKGWLGVRLDYKVDWDELADILKDGYSMSAPKRLSARLTGGAAASSKTTPKRRTTRAIASDRQATARAKRPKATSGCARRGSPSATSSSIASTIAQATLTARTSAPRRRDSTENRNARSWR